MIGSRVRRLTRRLHTTPCLPIKIEVEQIVEVVTSLALISSEKVEAIHVSNSTRTRSLLGLVSNWFNLGPFVLSNRVLVQVIQSLIIIGAREQVNAAVCKNTLVSSSRCEDLALRVYFDPLINLHLLEVLLWVGSPVNLFLLDGRGCSEGKLQMIRLLVTHLVIILHQTGVVDLCLV